MDSRKGIKRFLNDRTKDGEISLPEMTELAASLKKEGRREDYLYILQLLGREEIAENLKTRIDEILGKKRGDRIFAGLSLPSRTAPPEEILPFTEELMTRLLSLRKEPEPPSEKDLYNSLAGNAHGIPPEAFAGEKNLFARSSSLEEYLKSSHERAVATLQRHAESGELWCEQVITGEVVDFVRSRQDILGGELREGKIHVTKIPYNPEGWLKETDPRRKRYLACHCPMAREALSGRSPKIPPLWCACSAGFARQKFTVLFGEEPDIETVSTVLGGDDLCRFAISVPEQFLPGKK